MTEFADSGFEQAYRTAVGEQQTIDLPDGSKIILNTNSVLEAEFTKNARIIRLAEGEAYFAVAKDPAKPFSVETEKGTVTAVGTAFSVRVSDAEMNVLVSEGRVALSSAPLYFGAARTLSAQNLKPHSDVVEVDAGQAAVYDRQVRAIKDVAEKEIEHQLDWQDGLLAFHGEPLSEVVAEISHYTDVTIEIADPSLAERRVVAYYQVGKIEPMLEALKLSANVKVERIDERHVRLTQED
jgi:transmembrane sensor